MTQHFDHDHAERHGDSAYQPAERHDSAYQPGEDFGAPNYQPGAHEHDSGVDHGLDPVHEDRDLDQLHEDRDRDSVHEEGALDPVHEDGDRVVEVEDEA